MPSLYGDLDEPTSQSRKDRQNSFQKVPNLENTDSTSHLSFNSTRLLTPLNVIKRNPQPTADKFSWSYREDEASPRNDTRSETTNIPISRRKQRKNVAYDPHKPNEYSSFILKLKCGETKTDNKKPKRIEDSPGEINAPMDANPRPPPAQSLRHDPETGNYIPEIHPSRLALMEQDYEDQKEDEIECKEEYQDNLPKNTSTVLSGAPIVYQIPKIVAPPPASTAKSDVIVLTNIVKPEEVDKNLLNEVTEECSKYGKVYKCIIHKSRNPSSEEDSVKVFVQFADKREASRARSDLNKRFFGGRVVLASFFPKDRFISRAFD